MARRLRLPWARLGLGIALLASILSTAARSFHEQAGLHVRCAEHGELTHLPFAPAQQGAATRTGGTTIESSRRAAEFEADDHCPLASLLQQSSSEAKRQDTLAARLELPVVPHAIARALPDFREHVLRNAPKTSPPFAG